MYGLDDSKPTTVRVPLGAKLKMMVVMYTESICNNKLEH